jgi:hypothetical protein
MMLESEEGFHLKEEDSRAKATSCDGGSTGDSIKASAAN